MTVNTNKTWKERESTVKKKLRTTFSKTLIFKISRVKDKIIFDLLKDVWEQNYN